MIKLPPKEKGQVLQTEPWLRVLRLPELLLSQVLWTHSDEQSLGSEVHWATSSRPQFSPVYLTGLRREPKDAVCGESSLYVQVPRCPARTSAAFSQFEDSQPSSSTPYTVTWSWQMEHRMATPPTSTPQSHCEWASWERVPKQGLNWWAI